MKGSRSLFDHEADGDVLRLAGIGVHDSVSTARVVRGGLFGGVSPNGSRTDEALDAVRGKFGEGAIVRGTGFDTKLIQQGPSRVDRVERGFNGNLLPVGRVSGHSLRA